MAKEQRGVGHRGPGVAEQRRRGQAKQRGVDIKSVRVGLLRLVLASFVIIGRPVLAQSGISTWTEPIVLSVNEQANSPHLVKDPWGVLHAVWVGASDPGPRADTDMIYYARLDLAGWSQPVDVLTSPDGGSARFPCVAVTSDGTVHVIWTGPMGRIYYSSATYESASIVRAWSPPMVLVESGIATAMGHLVRDDNDTLHLASTWASGGSYGIKYMFSSDHGSTWSAATEVVEPSTVVIPNQPRLAITEQGTVHLVWSAVTAPNGSPPLGVSYARSENGGVTWSSPLKLALEGYGRATVGLQGENIVHVVWSGTVGYQGRYHRWSSDGGRNFASEVQLPGLADSFGGGTNDLAIDSSGAMHLVSGVEHIRHSIWREGQWFPPEVIADVVPDELEVDNIVEGGGSKVGILAGNTLICLYHDNWRVFVATRPLNLAAEPVQAPEFERTPTPAIRPADDAGSAGKDSASARDTAPVDATTQPDGARQLPAASGAQPLVLAAGSALVLTLMAVVISRRRMR